jgi:hypothetical protein
MIEALMKAKPGLHIQDIPKYLAAELNRVKVIQNTVSLIHSKIAKAKEDYEATKKALYAELSALRNNCKHETRSFNGDPAGGNDSYHSCDLCGKELH